MNGVELFVEHQIPINWLFPSYLVVLRATGSRYAVRRGSFALGGRPSGKEELCELRGRDSLYQHIHLPLEMKTETGGPNEAWRGVCVAFSLSLVWGGGH